MVTDAAFVISSTETLLSFSMSRYGNVYCSTPPFCTDAGWYGCPGGGSVDDYHSPRYEGCKFFGPQPIDRAVELHTQYVIPYNSRCVAYRNKGELNQAIEDYDKVLDLEPQFALVYFNRGFVYGLKED